MEEHNSQAKQSCSNGGSWEGVGGNSFDCNICLELAQDPVVTLCGHLFCWPCIYRWLHAHSIAQECPVCKAMLRQERLIPLYGAGKMDLNSTLPKPIPTDRGGGGTVPQRPTGQRPTTTDPTMFSNDHHEMRHRFNSMSGPHHGGFGLFPILFGLHGFADHALLSPSTSSRPGNRRMASPAPPQNAFRLPDRPLEEALLNKLFVFFACFVVVCLLFF